VGTWYTHTSGAGVSTHRARCDEWDSTAPSWRGPTLFSSPTPRDPRTYTNPPAGDNGIDLLCRSQSVPRQKDAPQSGRPRSGAFQAV